MNQPDYDIDEGDHQFDVNRVRQAIRKSLRCRMCLRQVQHRPVLCARGDIICQDFARESWEDECPHCQGKLISTNCWVAVNLAQIIGDEPLNLDRVLEELKCAVCLSTPRERIRRCNNLHSFCEGCIRSSQCPSDRTEMPEGYYLWMERLIRAMYPQEAIPVALRPWQQIDGGFRCPASPSCNANMCMRYISQHLERVHRTNLLVKEVHISTHRYEGIYTTRGYVANTCAYIKVPTAGLFKLVFEVSRDGMATAVYKIAGIQHTYRAWIRLYPSGTSYSWNNTCTPLQWDQNSLMPMAVEPPSPWTACALEVQLKIETPDDLPEVIEEISDSSSNESSDEELIELFIRRRRFRSPYRPSYAPVNLRPG